MGFLMPRPRRIASVLSNLDGDRVDEYGPKQIPAALEHLARADYLIGHNICGYDLPLLRRLHNWAPSSDCVVIDTLVASRLILPNLADLDDKAAGMGDPKLGKLRGRHSLEAWGVRLGIPKVGTDIEDWSEWTPEMQAALRRRRRADEGAISLPAAGWLQPTGPRTRTSRRGDLRSHRVRRRTFRRRGGQAAVRSNGRCNAPISERSCASSCPSCGTRTRGRRLARFSSPVGGSPRSGPRKRARL